MVYENVDHSKIEDGLRHLVRHSVNEYERAVMCPNPDSTTLGRKLQDCKNVITFARNYIGVGPFEKKVRDLTTSAFERGGRGEVILTS